MATEAIPGSGIEPATRLKAHAIGLPGATMQAVATIAPAIAALFFTQYVVSLTGVDAPFAYILGVCIVLMLGSTLVQLSKHMSSAGGYYTFVSRALGPRVGFMTAWMYVFYNPVCAGPIYAYFGYLLSQELKTHYSINAPVPVVADLDRRCSVRRIPRLAGPGALGKGARRPRPDGDGASCSPWPCPVSPALGPAASTFSSFVPTHSLSGEGFALAIVFSLQALTGWEAAAPLAEETSNPRRNVPLATMIAIIGLGIFLVICYWGQIVGWGTSILTGSSPKSMVNSPDLPGLVIAQRLWGGGWVIVLGAMFSSTLAVCQACNNVSTRIWFKMGETGTLPSWFGHVHPVHKTPTHAILANLVLSLAVGLGLGFGFNAARSYFLSNGLVLVLAVLYIYVSANVAVAFYYLKQRRSEFNAVLHIVLPVLSSAALFYVTYESFKPFPAFPYSLSPFIDGVWFVLGIGILLYLWGTKKETFIVKLGQAAVESDNMEAAIEDATRGA